MKKQKTVVDHLNAIIKFLEKKRSKKSCNRINLTVAINMIRTAKRIIEKEL